MEIDLAHDQDTGIWKTRLAGMDLVINAVGAIASSPGQSLEDIHTAGPIALFEACASLGIRGINISALGADGDATSSFHLTKKAADEHLLAIQPDSIVLQPSLVYGPGGASARMFDQLASLPVIPLPGDGMQKVQPVHIDDLVAAVVALANDTVRHTRSCPARLIPVVGPIPLALRDFLAGLRRAMGLGRARFIGMPFFLVAAGIKVSGWFGAPWASREVLGMLSRGNTADSTLLHELLGRAPRSVSEFISTESKEAVRLAAQISWLSTLLRVAIAVVWLAAAIVSFGLYPIAHSTTLVERMGVHGAVAAALVYAGAATDMVLGLATLLMRKRRLLWLAQMGVIVAYTAIITVWLPDFWLHPFGPVVKNIPLLAAIYVLYQIEGR